MRIADLHVDSRARRRSTQWSALALASALTLSAFHSVPTLAADPRQAAIEQVAREQGALPSDLEVVNERQATAEGGATLTALKVVDRRTGDIHSVYSNGGVTGGEAILQSAMETGAAQLTMLERKADAPLAPPSRH